MRNFERHHSSEKIKRLKYLELCLILYGLWSSFQTKVEQQGKKKTQLDQQKYSGRLSLTDWEVFQMSLEEFGNEAFQLEAQPWDRTLYDEESQTIFVDSLNKAHNLLKKREFDAVFDILLSMENSQLENYCQRRIVGIYYTYRGMFFAELSKHLPEVAKEFYGIEAINNFMDAYRLKPDVELLLSMQKVLLDMGTDRCLEISQLLPLPGNRFIEAIPPDYKDNLATVHSSN